MKYLLILLLAVPAIGQAQIIKPNELLIIKESLDLARMNVEYYDEKREGKKSGAMFEMFLYYMGKANGLEVALEILREVNKPKKPRSKYGIASAILTNNNKVTR